MYPSRMCELTHAQTHIHKMHAWVGNSIPLHEYRHLKYAIKFLYVSECILNDTNRCVIYANILPRRSVVTDSYRRSGCKIHCTSKPISTDINPEIT